MKVNHFIFLILMCVSAKSYAQNVNIPDVNFKYALVNNASINTNGDNQIQVSEANLFVGTMNLYGLGITDLTGIEAFTQLKELNCGFNSLTSLDLSYNTALTNLICEINSLSFLNISNNINLKTLSCRDNLFTSLNVSNNINLENLNCAFNQISSLDVANNTALKILGCDGNQLKTLDVSHNLALTNLLCGSNSLTTLDLSKNIALVQLTCYWNDLNFLSLINNINLFYLFCQYNPNLSCIEVWDASYASATWTLSGSNISQYMYFSNNCSAVSIIENDLPSSLSILPNPASDYLYISYKGKKEASFSILDIWGKKLCAGETHLVGDCYEKEVSIVDFPAGIYFLVVQSGDKKEVKKFVKD